MHEFHEKQFNFLSNKNVLGKKEKNLLIRVLKILSGGRRRNQANTILSQRTTASFSWLKQNMHAARPSGKLQRRVAANFSCDWQ